MHAPTGQERPWGASVPARLRHRGAEEVPGRWAGPCWMRPADRDLLWPAETGLHGRTPRRSPSSALCGVRDTRGHVHAHTAHAAHMPTRSHTCTCPHTRVPAHGCPPPLLPRLWPRGLPEDVTGHDLPRLENLTPVYLSGKFCRLPETLTLGHFPVVLLQLNAQREGGAVGHVHHLRPQNHHSRGLCWERAEGHLVGGGGRQPCPLTGVGHRAFGVPATGGLCVTGHERARLGRLGV